MNRFADRVVWLTGGSSGIGHALAEAFVREGAKVAVSGRRRDRLEAVVAQCEHLGGTAIPVPCDVTDEAAVEGAATAVVERFGRLDVAVANAGFTVGGAVAEVSAEDWRRQLDVNVVGAAQTARFALPHLRETQGRMAFTGSVAAFLPAPFFGPYHCSKHALRGLGLTLAAEVAGSGVSVTLCHPGFVASEITQVDNRGRRHPTRGDARPALLMWSTERAAKEMVHAIARRRTEMVFTGHGKIGAWLGMHAPGLLHLLMTRGSMEAEAASFRVE